MATDIEISGAKYRTCYETLSHIFAVLSNHGKALAGEDICRYNLQFCASFFLRIRIILPGLCEQRFGIYTRHTGVESRVRGDFKDAQISRSLCGDEIYLLCGTLAPVTLFGPSEVEAKMTSFNVVRSICQMNVASRNQVPASQCHAFLRISFQAMMGIVSSFRATKSAGWLQVVRQAWASTELRVQLLPTAINCIPRKRSNWTQRSLRWRS